MPATADQIVTRAAQELGILRTHGQNLQDQDNVRVTAGYAEVYAILKQDGHATWAYAGEVPDKLVPYVVLLVALSCLGSYGVSDARYTRISLGAGEGGVKAIAMIKQLNANTYASQSEPKDY